MNATRNQSWSNQSNVDRTNEIPTWKRILDILCIIAVSPVLVPVMATIALIILCGSRGPVLFRQIRVGHRGRPFECFKFRTMKAGASTAAHQAHLKDLIKSDAPMVKMDAKNDPRLVPGGWLLRATGLDELPQILNVLFGEMSLVGPRPSIPYEAEQFLPWQRERFNTLPGLTGLWQVSGKNRTTFSEMMQLDIQYVRTKSLWLDLFIMLRTFRALVIQVQDTRSGRKSFRAARRERAPASKQAVAA
jgi:lipopolysaccharide/colanic/teichoic acid biosynthesis glycosyltransferase